MQQEPESAMRIVRELGRTKRGDAKLTYAQVAAIRARYNAGFTPQTVIARELGVSPMTVCRVVNGYNWKPSLHRQSGQD